MIRYFHCFGIGSREWVHELKKIGIDSFDSASASIAVAFNQGFCKHHGRRNTLQVCKQFGDEMIAYEQYLNTPNPQLTLF